MEESPEDIEYERCRFEGFDCCEKETLFYEDRLDVYIRHPVDYLGE